MGNANSGRWKRQYIDQVATPQLADFDQPVPGETSADRKVRLINQLTHTKGPAAGKPFQLRPWQEHRIIRPLFATDDTGRRIVRTCLLMMPRKNGKSELAAALAIDGLMFDHEAGGEIYSAAADRDQAALVFNVAAQMIRNDPRLDAECNISDSQRKILHRRSGSVYRAISAEAYSKHGFNASRIIYDEVASAPTRELWDVLTTSTGARDQPLVIAISTAGYDRHSLLWELYAHAKRVEADPNLDPSFLPIVFEAPATADWSDESVWHACNPALGDFRSIEEMRTAAARAREIPAQENSFRRLYLNQWTEQASRWISLASWDSCGDGAQVQQLRGRRCFVGMDLSSTRDLTALVAVFPDASGFDVLAHFFVPADTLSTRGRTDRMNTEHWIRDGWMTATPGSVVNYDLVRSKLQQWGKDFDVIEIAFDPWNATDLVSKLSGQDGFTCVKMRQGFASLSAPAKSLETAILSHRLRHDKNPLLRLNVANVSTEQDGAGNIKPSKTASTDRIDGVIALVMAIDCMNRHDSEPEKKYQMIVMG